MGVIIVVLDDVGRVVHFNAAAERISGWRSEEVLGRPPWDNVAPPALSVHVLEEAFLGAMSRQLPERATQFESPWLNRSGQQRLVRWANTCFASPDDGRSFVVCAGIDVTDHHDIAERCERSESQLHLTQRAGRIGSWSLDVETGNLECSEGMHRLLGLDPRVVKLTGAALLGLLHPDDRRPAHEAYMRSLAERTHFRAEARLRTEGGGWKWLEAQCETVFDEAGRPRRSVGTVADVSDRVRAAEALASSEERLRLATRIADIGIFEHDFSTQRIYWSPALRDIFGVDHEREIDFTLVQAAVFPEDLPVFAAWFDRRLDPSSNALSDVEFRIVRPDGDVRWILIHTRTLFEGDGEHRPTRKLGACIDITERKRSEGRFKGLNEDLERCVRERTAALEHEIEQRRLILEATSDGFCIVDQNGRILDVNPAGCELLGYPRRGLIMRSASNLDCLDSADEAAQHLGRIASAGRGRFDTLLRRCDGSLLPIEVSASMVEVDGSALFFAFFRDISERVESCSRLAEAKDAAELANQAKGEFLSRMSHELRTPLNAILGFSQILGFRLSDDDGATHVREILHAGTHLLALIDDVLDLTRIESGKVPLTAESVAVDPVVQECLSLLAPQAAAHNVTFSCGDLIKAPFVRADRTRLKQVLLNLLTNAVKYNKAGGTVTISTKATSYEGAAALRIAVQDTGVGISAIDQSRLFVPFERALATAKTVEGTGLGLAVTKRLVELMAGSIGYDSRPDVGSTFWIVLPLAPPPSQVRPVLVAPAPVTAATDPPRHSILCIEDNPANLRLIEAVFARRRDVRLFTAANPKAGIELAAAQRPALIILDINLPEFDGFEVLRRLRESERTRNIPVIGVSAMATNADLERGHQAGFAEYVTKPIDVSQLLNLVDRCLAGSQL